MTEGVASPSQNYYTWSALFLFLIVFDGALIHTSLKSKSLPLANAAQAMLDRIPLVALE